MKSDGIERHCCIACKQVVAVVTVATMAVEPGSKSNYRPDLYSSKKLYEEVPGHRDAQTVYEVGSLPESRVCLHAKTSFRLFSSDEVKITVAGYFCTHCVAIGIGLRRLAHCIFPPPNVGQ
jgi:hypothetical protein